MLGWLFRPRSVDELIEVARACLEWGDAHGALRYARRIEKRRSTAAIEIGGLALQALGRRTEAIAWLERGVALAPTAWCNWQLLGNLRSECGDLDGARAAYERALACPDVWRASVVLNRAIAESRADRFESALTILDGVDDARLALRAAGARCHALRSLHRHAECIDEVDRLLASERAAGAMSDEDRDSLAYIAVQRILARLACGEPRSELRRETLDALKRFARHVELFGALRTIDARPSALARTVDLFVSTSYDGDPSLEDGPRGWSTSFEVVAETWEQAVEFALEIERATAPWPADFEVDGENSTDLGPAPGALLGVVRSKRH